MSTRLVVLRYLSSIMQPRQLHTKEMLERYMGMNRIEPITPTVKTRKVMDAEVSQHAADRWNERVGPIVTKSELVGIIGYLMNQPERIEFLSSTVGLMDRDIIFTYERMGHVIMISTFYGRLSEQPILNNFAAFRHFNRYERQRVDLGITKDRLQAQMLPPIPRQTMLCKGRRNHYRLEEYMVSEGSYITIEIRDGLSGRRRRWGFLVDEQPHGVLMNKSIQRALCMMGFGKWVNKYAHLSWMPEVAG
ncbi:hypothetical protein [Paenibacillus puerhi]|uniref:hypothetical protein n=1 Tax=Paenibacillus puerhi TaxID=2692622 RepID=UPI001358E8ED|nr:hypothetical protein [Paenibacillus puerhi]